MSVVDHKTFVNLISVRFVCENVIFVNGSRVCVNYRIH